MCTALSAPALVPAWLLLQSESNDSIKNENSILVLAKQV
jgi:hypothetical protein